MPDQWYYTERGQRRGPVSENDLGQLAASGQLKPSDLVWKRGMASWEQAGRFDWLFASQATKPPVPPPNEPRPQPVEPSAPASQPWYVKMAQAQHTGRPASEEATVKQLSAPVQAPPQKPTSPAADKLNAAGRQGKAVPLSLAGRSKSAAQLVAKQAERTKLTQITLPNAYRAVGKHVHAGGRFRPDFADAYGRIDALLADIAKLTAMGPAVEGFKGKAKAAAQAAKNKTHAQALHLKLNHEYTELGRAAFDKHGDRSGPPDVVKPIIDCRARLETLAAEMVELSKSAPGTVLTPKRILIGGLAVAALLLIVVAKVTFFGGTHDGTQVAKTTDDQLSAVESNETFPAAVNGRTANKRGHYAAAFAEYLERSKKKYSELEREEGKAWNDIAEDRRVECNEALQSELNQRLRELPPPQLQIDASARTYVADAAIKPPRFSPGFFGFSFLSFPLSLTASKPLDKWKHGLFCRVLGLDGTALEDCSISLNVAAGVGDAVSADFQVAESLEELTTLRICYRPREEPTKPENSRADVTPKRGGKNAETQTTDPPEPDSQLPVPKQRQMFMLSTEGNDRDARLSDDDGELISSVAFSTDGTRAVTGGADGAIYLWDVKSRALVKRLDTHKGRVNAAAFLPSGKHGMCQWV